MLEGYSGATRIYPIIGDPIAQVKSPITTTTGLRARGVDAIVVPVHVTPGDVDAVIAAMARVKNVDGLIATVPHKFAAYRHCATATPRSRLLEAANMVRRNADGAWHGDMLDGVAFVDTARRIGVRFEGARALLVGAGGAGSAIGLALLEAGVMEVAVHDANAVRRDALLRKLEGPYRGRVRAGSTDPTGFDVVANATPSGMVGGNDTPPVDLHRLTSKMFVGDVVTDPAMTPLLVAARAAGARTRTGVDMVTAAVDLQVDFLLGTSA